MTELEGHTDLVTAVIVVPVAESARKFMCYCWTSSLDGTICYWDFAAPELVKKVKVQVPILSMVSGSWSNLSRFIRDLLFCSTSKNEVLMHFVFLLHCRLFLISLACQLTAARKFMTSMHLSLLRM